MNELLGDGNLWLILGVALVVVEIIGNLGYWSLSLGIGSLVTGVLSKIGLLPSVFGLGLVEELLVASAFSVMALLVARRIAKRQSDSDINKY